MANACRTGGLPSRQALEVAEVGSVFIGPVRRLSIERVLAFSGGAISEPDWPEQNLHTNMDKAREAGLPGIIVSGTQFEGHLIDLLVELFGDTWFGAGTIESKIPKSLMLNDTVQAKAIVGEISGEGDFRTFSLEVSCENQNGEQVLIGTAACPLHSRTG